MGSITAPIASAGARSPARSTRIPQAVKSACLQMIHEAADFIEAARTHGIKPDTMRRWLHRPEVVSLIRRERAAFRHAVCAANERVLADIRDKGENVMARVKAVQTLEQLDDAANERPGAAAGPVGVTIRIINQIVPPAAEPTIDVMSRRVPEPDAEPPSRLPEPIFKV